MLVGKQQVYCVLDRHNHINGAYEGVLLYLEGVKIILAIYALMSDCFRVNVN